MKQFARPRIVLSRCLEMEKCRWNGDVIRSEVVRELVSHVDFVTACPEADIGLGIPRDPIRAAWDEGALRLFQPTTGVDVTQTMTEYSREFLDKLGEVDGFLLKSRSPSCGFKDVKYYHSTDQKAMVKEKGAGFFGGAVIEAFPDKIVEDEGRLLNFSLREHFFTRVFTEALCRDIRHHGKMADLVQFQAANKYLLMAYNPSRQKELGRIVANPDKLPFLQTISAYEKKLEQALTTPPKYTANINVLQHCFGYVSDLLTTGERKFFLDALERYRQGMIPLSVPRHMILGYAVRFDQPYLLQQTYFQPYPEVLMDITDSGKGVDR